jgi:hypothetical protein
LSFGRVGSRDAAANLFEAAYYRSIDYSIFKNTICILLPGFTCSITALDAGLRYFIAGQSKMPSNCTCGT